MTMAQNIPKQLDLLSLIKVLAEPMETIVVITDAALDTPGPTVLYANPAYKGMTGYDPEEAIGQSPRMLQGPRTNKALLKKLKRSLEAGEHAQATVVNYRKNGEAYNCNIAAWPIVNEQGDITNFIALERELKRKRGRPAKTQDFDVPWWLEKLVETPAHT